MNGTIRLACSACNRDDMDGVMEEDLEAAKVAGWRSVIEVQSYEDSIKTYEDEEDPPPGYSVLDWYTHIGLCPECSALEGD